MDTQFNDKEIITMKLLHYFITEKNYNPVVLHGVKDEIWLENMESEYKIVRIVSNYIHNNEQLNFDLFKTKKIVKNIKKKTLNINMNVLSIFTDLGDNVELHQEKHINCINLKDEKDMSKYDFIYENFPDIEKKLTFTEKGMNLFLKITNDINKTNINKSQKIEKVFKPQKPIITNILIGINVAIFLFGFLLNKSNWLINEFSVYGPYIRAGQFYRLLTGMFIHADIIHIMFNMYALYILGTQAESFFGKTKYLIIYIISGLTGSLLSIFLNGTVASIGASGAIFGLMGALLYFGYYYRVYLGNVVKSQIIPLILLNLLVGFMSQGIDNAAHIGGLIGGVFATMAVGVKYKTTSFEMINGVILYIILVGFLLYMTFTGMLVK